MRTRLAAAAAVLLLSGCGSGPVVVEGQPGSSPYDGPMSLPLDRADGASVLARSGAAGRALECSGEPYLGGSADYDTGLATVQDTASDALANLFAEDFGGQVPTVGYRVERRERRRVLLSYDVDGRTKVSFVVAADVRDWTHHTGWGVEAWAQCDPAELPAAVTDELGIQVWTTGSGERIPVTAVTSRQGPAHCDWQDITFLTLGEDPIRYDPRGEEYVRDTRGELAELLRTTFRASGTLPTHATDTGWRHDGRELWLVPDRTAAYLVRPGAGSDVERWPAASRPILCD